MDVSAPPGSAPSAPGPPALAESPKPQPMAFTIEFSAPRAPDAARRELLARQSQARHQRVHSMSASLHRHSPTAAAPLKPPMSAKLPRKAQGYNSEGYFSSDQEDSVLSGSVKLKRSPLAQSNDLFKPHNLKSPVVDVKPISSNQMTDSIRIKSKSPIVDSIMSRSDTLPSRYGLNLPLKLGHASSYAQVQDSPNYSTLSSSYSKHDVMSDIIDQSPDGLMLTDISSPEMDMLTPENVLSSPEYKIKSPRANYAISVNVENKIGSPQLENKVSSPKKQIPDLFKKCMPKNELEILEDCDRHSNSSTGTYTIEGDNYSEEQKARMSIDRTFGVDLLKTSLTEALERRSLSRERDPELVLDLSAKTKDYRPRDACHSPRSPLNRTFELPKVSTDRNVLEITCCYEPASETDLATQTFKQIKSTRNYLEKIKSRVRTISEKTFQKPPAKPTSPQDQGSFTSVTTSGVLSAKSDLYAEPRRVSLSQSQHEKTEYVHRLTRESSVPVSLPSAKKTPEKTILPFDDGNFESEVLRNAHAIAFKDAKDDSGISDVTPERVVGTLSCLSLNRCKGDKTWIQEWADSVKKYNSDALGKKPVDLNGTFVLSGDRPPSCPRNQPQVKCANVGRSGHSAAGMPTKIPSPVHSRPIQETLTCNSDTESYLLRTQTAITNLQAKLHTKNTSPTSNLPPLMTSSFVSEKTAASRLPVSQLSRSNSLNYRLRKRDNSADSSPLRSPGNYVITGSGIPTSTKLLIAGASRSLDTEPRYPGFDSNMNSPERCTYSNSSEEKTLSNKTYEGHRKMHARHRSFDGHNSSELITDNANLLGKVSLKTVLTNNAFEAQRIIEPTRCQSNRLHVRVYSDSPKVVTQKKPLINTIRRSSSFNTVNRNNNYIDSMFKSANQSGNINQYAPKDTDYLSDESDNGSYSEVKPQLELRYNRAMILRRERLESPNLKSIAPANSPRCPNTPEMGRKFGPGLVRNSGRVANQRALNSRMSEPPRPTDREMMPGQQGRKISDTTRLEIVNRLTKSRSTTRDFAPKNQERAAGKKKPNQHRSSTSLASKEQEFTNWKKRSSYDPMKAAQEGKRRQQQRQQESNKDDLSSPSHSSPVHRSQSFNSTNMAGLADLAALDYSSEETEDDLMVSALPPDHPMVTSTHSDAPGLRRRGGEHRDALRRRPVKNDVALMREYVANFQINPPEKLKLRRDRDADKRKTFIIDDTTPTEDNVEPCAPSDMENTFTIEHNGRAGEQFRIDKKWDHNTRDNTSEKRKTFIIDSDTNSTTNGSSPRNSSIFSHEKHSLTTTGASDTEGESGTESAPVVLRKKGTAAQPAKRHSGDYSVSSSAASAGPPRRSIQPRYLDISKYKNESSPKNFLRKDPSKTYIGALGPSHSERAHSVSKGSAREHEMEQKKQELEKWKRRASYDPRKAAALGKTSKTPPKTASSVLRSQSFHGPVLGAGMSSYAAPHQIAESYDQSSDNDF